jgi:GGDEF domain-containing protein
VTGLPDRAAAEALFQKLYADGERKYVLTVVTDRLRSIHSRFGSTACDAVMKIMAEYVSQRLPDATGVFKWSDSAIVAVLHRKDMIDRVRAELRGVLDRVIDPTIDIDNRSVLIPLTLSWSLVGLVPPRSLVTRHIDIRGSA